MLAGQKAHRIRLDIGQAQNKALQDLFAPYSEAMRPPAPTLTDELWISGDNDRVETVDQLVRLVRRAKTPDYRARQPEDFVRRNYRMSKSDAAALARVLSFTDWSVRFTHDGETLRVVAPTRDQKVIESVVTLLEGDRED